MIAILLNVTFAAAQPEPVSAPSAPSEPVSATATSKACTESKEHGAADADERHSTVGWWAGGVGSGFLLGLIGTGIIWGISMASNPQPETVPDAVNENCYRNGYKKEARGQNKVAAGVGGLIGTVVIVTVILSSSSN